MTEEQALEIIRCDIARDLAIHGRIAEAERRAQERVRRRSSLPRNFGAFVEALQDPALRSVRGFNSSGSFTMPPRPKAPDTGGVTFHFSVTSVSKMSRTVAAYAGRTPSGRADQHESYIERDQAAETFIDPESRAFNQEHAVDGQEYIERPSALEEFISRDSIIVSSFGNIAATKEERLEFWKKLEAFERSPRGHKFTIDPFRGSDFWAAVQKHADAGRIVPAPLAKAMQRCLSDVSPLEVTLEDKDAIDLLKYAHSIGDFQTDGAIKVAFGRGGRVQTRIIAELPHEVTPAHRLKLAKKYCAEFERLGLPYWAVIHAPDKHNDRRNFHIHITLSERPAKRMPHPSTGQILWDFEIARTYKSECRHVRTSYPYAQKRNRDLHNSSWIKKERQRFCAIMNGALEASGSSKRYDPRPYTEMGITKMARKRIDPKLYAKERKGQVTEQGRQASREQWPAAVDDLHENFKKAAGKVADASYKNRLWFHALQSAGHPGARQFQGLMRKAADLHNLILSAIVAEAAVSFVADKMVSRARLKKPARRTVIDNVLIAVASEIRTAEVKQFRAVAEKLRAEYHAKSAEIAQIRNTYIRQFQKSLFSEMVSRFVPPSVVPSQEKTAKTTEERIADLMADAKARNARIFTKYKPLFDPSLEQKASETLKSNQSSNAKHPSLRDVFRPKANESLPRQQVLNSSRPPEAHHPKPAPTQKLPEPLRNMAVQPPSIIKPSTTDGRLQDTLSKPQQPKHASNTIPKRPHAGVPERSLPCEGAQLDKTEAALPIHAKDKLQPPGQIPGNVPEIPLNKEARKRKKRKDNDQAVSTKEKTPEATTPANIDLQRLIMIRWMRDKGRGR